MGKSRFGRATRVLVVDDNEDLRLSTKFLLEQAGYRVEVAANGREALEVQRQRPAQLLVTDLFMPDADGFETIERFRKEFPEVRIVAISGGASLTAMRTDHLPVAHEIGAHATLRKPYALEKLIETLQKV
jgi:two-component system, chemotaxis family, chemotaxis protein CheY